MTFGCGGFARIRRLNFDLDLIETVAGSVDPFGDGPFPFAKLGNPKALTALSDSHWLVADGSSSTVRQLDLTTQWQRSVAGYQNPIFGREFAPEQHDIARFSRQLGKPAGIAFHAATGRVFVGERDGHCIRAIDTAQTPWRISTVAGLVGQPGHQDGLASDSRFDSPAGLAIDVARDLLYIADSGNQIVRAMDLSAEIMPVTTVVGSPQEAGFAGDDGPANLAWLLGPEAVTVGTDGSLYVADTWNHRVRRVVDPFPGPGTITTVIGDGSAGSGGEGNEAWQFPVDQPRGLSVDAWGNLFVSSRTAVRVISAGPDGLATGADPVRTIFGKPPREGFPEALSHCLTDLATTATSLDGDDAGLLILDQCEGFVLSLERRRL